MAGPRDACQTAGSAGLRPHLSPAPAGNRSECLATPSTSSSSHSAPTNILRSMTRSRRRSNEGMSPADNMMSNEEYDALPASIRKKYFTTKERALITGQGLKASTQRRRKPMPEPCHISTLPDDWKPNSDRKTTKSSMTSSFLRSRRRHSRPNIEQATVSEEQAAWFLSLPDKVKRQHFSKEEQTLLTYRCEIALDKMAPKAEQESAQDFCRRRLTRHFEQEQSTKLRRRTSAPASVCIDDKFLAEVAQADAQRAVDDGKGEEDDDEEKTRTVSLYSRRHSIATIKNSAPAVPIIPPAQIRSFRRSFALKPLPLPAPILAPAPSPGFFKDQKPARLSKRTTQHSISLPMVSPSEAKHYQDPEVRQALRTHTSPKLFDEALEYGFPAPPNVQPVPKEATRRGKAKKKQSPEARVPDADRSSSLTSSSTANSLDKTLPSTPPESADFAEPVVANNDTSSETSQRPPPPNLLHRRAMTADHHRTPSFANREMTLRMTLTRPILRDPEEQPAMAPRTPIPQPVIDQSDPLALESITVCDDPTGAQGAFAIPENSQHLRGIKKALKQLVRK